MAAAVLYFAIVFGVGFGLGPIRVLWLEPALGKALAVRQGLRSDRDGVTRLAQIQSGTARGVAEHP